MQRKSREAVSCRAETKKGTVSPSAQRSSANWSSAPERDRGRCAEQTLESSVR